MACSRENDDLEGATRGGYSADGQQAAEKGPRLRGERSVQISSKMSTNLC